MCSGMSDCRILNFHGTLRSKDPVTRGPYHLMTWPFYVLNFGYLLIFIGLAVRDILWLRCILLVGHICQVIYAVPKGAYPTAFWNSLFSVVNTVQIIAVIRERTKVPIPKTFEDIYENIFSNLSTREFLYFWSLGEISTRPAGLFLKEGDQPHEVFLLLSGEAHVQKANHEVALLERGHFMAEMSFLTDGRASADIVINHEIGVIGWPHEKLNNLKKLNPALYVKIQGILGRDVANKAKKLG